MAQAPRDQNSIPTLLGVSNADGTTPVTVYADPTTHRLLVSSSSGGDVVGPASSTDNAIARFDGTTGKLLQNSTVIVGDTGNITGVGNITGIAGGITITGGTASGDDIRITSTSNATKGTITLGSTTLGPFIDETNGVLYVGSTNSTVPIFGANFQAGLMSFVDSGIQQTNFATCNAGVGGGLFGMRVNGTLASPTIVDSGDTLFSFGAIGYDGSTGREAATIRFVVDGTTGSGVMPGKILFSTTADGASSPTERLHLDSAGVFMPATNDGVPLGKAGNSFSDLFLAEGAVINWDDGDATITQTGNVVALAGADLRVATADVGTNADSVPTLSSTSTFTNKTLTSPTLTTPSAFTTGGTITLAENTSIALDPAGSADGKYTGITVTGTAGYTQAFGDVVYLDPTDSRWEACDANAASGADGDSRGIVGMVVSAGTDGTACTILLNGIIRADAKFPSFTVNNPIYISETAGSVTQTQPTTTDVVIRVLGFALTADEMYFAPSSDYITHT